MMQKIHASIDTSCRRVTRAGTTRYLEGLLRGLADLPKDKIHVSELEWPVDNLNYKQPERLLKTFFREFIWAPFLLPKAISASKPDIFHTPSAIFASPSKQYPHVCTLHDMALFRHPERFRPWQRIAGIHRSKKILHADHVIAISSFSAAEAMKFLGLPPSKISVVYHGCDFSGDSKEKVPASFAVPPEFFLFVGSLEPGKNLELLRQAWFASEASGKILPPLIVVGARWHGVAREGEWPSSWIEAGHLPDEELAYLYRRTLALLFPSKYEGFGFPPLEAMKLGAPVICAPVASIPEVVGDAALFTNLDANDFLKSIYSLLGSQSLRGELVSAGKKQAEKFSWKLCAEETYGVYQKALCSRATG
jgi:glycosyltransferase involved in cell wall biosynthesis